MWSCSSSNSNQIWEEVSFYGGRTMLRIAGSNPELYLSSKTLDAQVYLTRETTASGDPTAWVFVGGTIRPRNRQDLCVDQQWNGTSKGTKLWLWPCNGTSAQIFYIEGNIVAPDDKCLAQQSGSDYVTTASCIRSSTKQIWQWCF